MRNGSPKMSLAKYKKLANVSYWIFGFEFEFVSWTLCSLLIHITFMHDYLYVCINIICKPKIKRNIIYV